MDGSNSDIQDSADLEYKNLKTRYAQLQKQVQERKLLYEVDLRKQQILEQKHKQDMMINFLDKNYFFDKLQILWSERKNPVTYSHLNIKCSKNILYIREINILLTFFALLIIVLTIVDQKYQYYDYFSLYSDRYYGFNPAKFTSFAIFTSSFYIIFLLFITIVPTLFVRKQHFNGDSESFNDILSFTYSSKNAELPQNILVKLSNYKFSIIYNKKVILKGLCKNENNDTLLIDRSSLIFSDSLLDDTNWLQDFLIICSSLTGFIESDLKKKTSLLEQELLESSF
jgi:hypothetical protein